LVLLHGFAGTRRSWDLVAERLDRERYTPIALDLRGHGAARDVRPIDVAGCVEDVLAAAPARFALCGYSMGGRVALHVALAAVDRVSELVLVAATAGIEGEEARAVRRREDDALADEVEGMDMEAFVARWTSMPIFAGTPSDAATFWTADLRRNQPDALAAALRGLGGGAMEPAWDRLGELRMPATVVVGERDAKFVAIGERLVRALPAARPLVVVPGAGHGLPRDAPEAVAAAISGLRTSE
jgi:2-succinyl-6-hydroxy-2,4-cyclohexadiene-1-carboxylate synthase